MARMQSPANRYFRALAEAAPEDERLFWSSVLNQYSTQAAIEARAGGPISSDDLYKQVAQAALRQYKATMPPEIARRVELKVQNLDWLSQKAATIAAGRQPGTTMGVGTPVQGVREAMRILDPTIPAPRPQPRPVGPRRPLRGDVVPIPQVLLSGQLTSAIEAARSKVAVPPVVQSRATLARPVGFGPGARPLPQPAAPQVPRIRPRLTDALELQPDARVGAWPYPSALRVPPEPGQRAYEDWLARPAELLPDAEREQGLRLPEEQRYNYAQEYRAQQAGLAAAPEVARAQARAALSPAARRYVSLLEKEGALPEGFNLASARRGRGFQQAMEYMGIADPRSLMSALPERVQAESATAFQPTFPTPGTATPLAPDPAGLTGPPRWYPERQQRRRLSARERTQQWLAGGGGVSRRGTDRGIPAGLEEAIAGIEEKPAIQDPMLTFRGLYRELEGPLRAQAFDVADVSRRRLQSQLTQRGLGQSSLLHAAYTGSQRALGSTLTEIKGQATGAAAAMTPGLLKPILVPDYSLLGGVAAQEGFASVRRQRPRQQWGY